MKLSYTIYMNKAEMDAVKEFTKDVVEHFEGKMGGDVPSANYRVSAKFTAGNMLAFFRMKDTYEVSLDIDMDERYVIEYLAIASRALPLVGGLFNVFSELSALHDREFELIESDVTDLDKA